MSTGARPVDPPPAIAQITPLELKRRLEAGERVVLLDVREPDERARAVIPAGGSSVDLFLPLGQVAENLDALRAQVTQAQAPLVVYCHHGVRSSYAARWLSAQGLAAVTNLTGGIDAYSLGADPGVPRY